MHQQDRAARKQPPIVVAQPVDRPRKLLLVLIKRRPPGAPRNRVDNHQLRPVLLNQLHKPVVPVQIPPHHHRHRIPWLELQIPHLLLDLHLALIAIQDQHRPLLHRHQIPPHLERKPPRHMLRQRPRRHRLPIPTSPVDHHRPRARQQIRNQVLKIQLLAQQRIHRNLILLLFVLHLANQ